MIIDDREYWVFSTKDYENMGDNFQTFLKVIKQQKTLIEAYKKCVE